MEGKARKEEEWQEELARQVAKARRQADEIRRSQMVGSSRSGQDNTPRELLREVEVD